MSDIVERLRGWPLSVNGPHTAELCKEAADEIERLQKELVETRKWRQQTAEFCDRARDERDYYRDKYHEQAALGSDDEIERLRAALDRIAEGCDLSNEAQAIAREALRDE